VGLKLGQLVIELAANTARLQGDLGKAVGMAERAAAGMKKAFSFVSAGAGGGLIGAALIGAAKHSIELGDNLNKAAIKAGVSSKAISELAYVAKLADVDLASLSTALKKMQVAISEAGTGSKQAQGALSALGLTFEQIQKRKPEAQFSLIADRISKLADPADKARAATDLFGKAGADLLPLFEQGAAGIAKATAEARKLGLSFGDDDLKSLSNADDSIKRLSASWEGFAATLTAKVAPALSDVLDRMSGVDTRAADVQVASITKTLANMQGLIGPEFERQRKELQDRLSRAQLQLSIDQQNKLGTGTFGGPSSRTADGTAIGYASADAAAEAAAAAKKAAAANAKEMEKFLDGYRDAVLDMNATVDKDADEALKSDMNRWMERQDAANEFYDNYLKREKEAEVARDEAAQRSAQFFKDTFLQAFDDWINTGKFKLDQFLKYIAAQWSRNLIANALNGSSSGGSDWLGSLIGGISGAFSSGTAIDGKAGGGDVNAGQTYLIGEKGMELFRPRQSGTIVPNHALGGGSVAIDASITINGGVDGVSRAELLAGQREQTRRIYDELDRRGVMRTAA
jgi:hypothetical protein